MNEDKLTALARRIARMAPEARRTLLAKLRAEGIDFSLLPIVAARGDATRFPASYAQNRLWFIGQLEPTSSAYNMTSALRMRGELDRAALQRTFDDLVARHESLRTSFHPGAEAGGALQEIHPPRPLEIRALDLRGLPPGAREAEVLRLADADTLAPFDLTRAPLFRASLLQLAEREHVLLVTMHHIISDGWSMNIVIEEFARLYEAHASGAPLELPPLRVQYADYAGWQRAWMEAGEADRQLAYWEKQLGGEQPVLALPFDRPRPAISSYAGATSKVELEPALGAALRALAQREDVTLATLLLASYAVLLARHSGESDLRIGTSVANRNRLEVEGLVGFFVNELVIRLDLGKDLAFDALLREVKRTTLAAQEHQDLPFERLVEALHPQRSLSHNPLFQVAFNHRWRALGGLDAIHRLQIEPLELDSAATQFDLSLHTTEENGVIGASFGYMTDLFDRASVERLAAHWLNLLRAVVAAPGERIHALGLLSPDERTRITRTWNATGPGDRSGQRIDELVLEQARARDRAIAVSCGDRSVSFRELAERAEQLARFLRARGAGPDALVGVCVERGLEMVVGLLGVLRAGAAYLPLDPQYPSDRLRYMLEDAGVSLLLTEERLLPALPPTTARTYCLDRDWGELSSAAPGEAPVPARHEAQLAYCIYTSGSTGRPKGALIHHAGLTHYVRWAMAAYGLAELDGAILHSSIAFDLTVTSLWVPLCAGKRVVIVPPGADAVEGLAEALRSAPGRLLLKLTPSHALALSELEGQAPGREPPELRAAIVGGEQLSWDNAAALSRWAPRCRIVNEYGPTETVVGCCVHDAVLAERRAHESAVAIGKPIAGTQLYVLDRALEPVAVGVPGELYIGGRGVARGYHGKPGLSAARFVPDPFGEPGGRLYRTGDIARYREDGVLEYLGRCDDQVKLRGYRIELDEIASQLREHPAVADGAVVVREDVPGQKRLVAYVAADLERARAEARGASAELVGDWNEVFEGSYGVWSSAGGPSFAGWNSSYTDEPIPEEQMREWLDARLARLRALAPRRVFEIGCGVGLIVEGLALGCESYLAADFSARAVTDLGAWLGTRLGFEHVVVMQREANDFSAVRPGVFDTVVLNSVIQYFPDVGYLLDVLRRASEAAGPRGHVFVGDVRSLPLLRAFHASVQLERLGADATVQAWREAVARAVREDKELVIDPALFEAVAEWNPHAGSARVLIGRGRHDNELTRYRYDVVLAGREQPRVDPSGALELLPNELSLAHLDGLLQAQRPAVVRVRGVENRRLAADRALLAWLDAERDHVRLGALRERLARLAPEGEDPDRLYELGEARGYEVTLSWSSSGGPGSVDVLLVDPARAPRRAAPAPAPNPAFDAQRFANEPLLAKRAQALGLGLRRHLEARLPDYMVPAQVVVLDALPLTVNGKLDRDALPAPDRRGAAAQHVAPRDPIEARLAEIWGEVLGLERVGVTDNFFERGGDSIVAVQVVSRARQAGFDLTPRDVFQFQTIDGLARAVAERGAAERSAAARGPAEPGGSSADAASATSADALLEQLPFWSAQLADPESLSLPRDRGGDPARAEPVEVRARAGTFRAEADVLELAQAYRATPDDLLLAAAARALCTWARTRAVAIELPGGFPLRLAPDLGGSPRALGAALQIVKEQRRKAPHGGRDYAMLRQHTLAIGDALRPRPRVAYADLSGQSLASASERRPEAGSLMGHDGGAPPGATGPLWATPPSPPAASPSSAPELAATIAASAAASAPETGDAPWLHLGARWLDERLQLEVHHDGALHGPDSIDRLLDGWARELEALLAHCARASGVTPSDFPLSPLSQPELDQLPVPARELEDIYPLSPLQQGLLFHYLYSPGSEVYVHQLSVAVEGLDVARFRAAWQAAIDRHPALRTGFAWQGELSQPVQIVRRRAELVLDEVPLGAAVPAPAELERLAEQERARPFELTEPPLSRLLLVELGEGRHQLIWTHHHILMDGWSVSRLIGDVFRHYAGQPFRESAGSYRDYAAWLGAQSEERSRRFWAQHLAPLEEPTLLARAVGARAPGDGGSREPATGHAAERAELGGELTRALRRLAERERVTLNTLIQAAWVLILQRYTGQRAVAFGATVSGRSAGLPGLDDRIGLFINTLPLVQRPAPGRRLADWLRALQADNLELREQEHARLHDIQRWQGRGGQALFDSIVVFENFPVDRVLRGGIGAGLRFGEVHTLGWTNYPLTLVVNDAESLSIDFGYAREHFDAPSVAALARHMTQLLAGMARAPERALGNLGLLTDGERRDVARWNATRRPEPPARSVHQAIERHAAERPGDVAVVLGDETLSFGALDERAGRLARWLRGQGVGPDQLVGVCLGRSFELVVSLLAVLKAGGAYVPLDPEYPAERLRGMLAGSGARVLLTESRLAPSPALAGVRVFRVDRDAGELPSDAAPLPAVAAPEHLAYCIYTSGSTGKPKGVQLTRRGLDGYVRWAIDAYRVREIDAAPLHSSIGFDLTITSLWLPLCAGQRVELVPEASVAVEALAEWLQRSPSTQLVKLTPSHATLLAGLVRRPLPQVRAWIVGGEALTADHVEALERLAPNSRVINEYGPTESVVGCCIWDATASGDSLAPAARSRGERALADSVPIGLPIDDTELYVVDPAFELAPPGVAGELCIAGEALARGYRGAPGLTADRFVPNPFSERPGARLYRTGDLVRQRADGVLLYLGRIDQQVKIRGFRIELGEIEARLREHPAVRDAVVVAKDGPRGQQLVAYLVARDPAGEGAGGRELPVAALREHLRRTLPEYMLPAEFMALDEIPLTHNGKVDPRALPEPQAAGADYVEPRSELARSLAQVWREVLGVERVGMNDNFFERGGHSVLALQVIEKIRSTLHRNVPLRCLFETASLAAFERAVESEGYALARAGE